VLGDTGVADREAQAPVLPDLVVRLRSFGELDVDDATAVPRA